MADQVETLIESLGDEDWSTRSSAAKALGQIGDVRSVEPLIELLGDENGYVRIRGAYTLAQIGDARAVEPLIELLRDDDWSVRSSVAKTLGVMGDARAVEPLIELLRDDDATICSSAVDGLVKIGEPAVEPLILSLWDAEETVLQRVSHVLDTIDNTWATKESTKKHLPYFSEALKKGNMPVKLYMIGVLEKIGGPGASEILTRALEAEDETVRSSAAKALERIKNSGFQ